MQEAKRVFEQIVGRLRAEMAGDKEAALSSLRRETDEELQVTSIPTRVLPFSMFLYYREGIMHEGLKVQRRWSQERLQARKRRHV